MTGKGSKSIQRDNQQKKASCSTEYTRLYILRRQGGDYKMLGEQAQAPHFVLLYSFASHLSVSLFLAGRLNDQRHALPKTLAHPFVGAGPHRNGGVFGSGRKGAP